jgi:hypothetical protein
LALLLASLFTTKYFSFSAPFAYHPACYFWIFAFSMDAAAACFGFFVLGGVTGCLGIEMWSNICVQAS